MPIIRTALPHAFAPERRLAVAQGVHDALVSAIGMPQDEFFNLVQPYAPGEFIYDRRFNGYARGEESVVMVEITMRRGRSDAMKRALYAAIADNLAARAEVKPADLVIFIHENDYSDWSMGGGAFAMTLTQQRGPN